MMSKHVWDFERHHSCEGDGCGGCDFAGMVPVGSANPHREAGGEGVKANVIPFDLEWLKEMAEKEA